MMFVTTHYAIHVPICMMNCMMNELGSSLKMFNMDIGYLQHDKECAIVFYHERLETVEEIADEIFDIVGTAKVGTAKVFAWKLTDDFIPVNTPKIITRERP